MNIMRSGRKRNRTAYTALETPTKQGGITVASV